MTRLSDGQRKLLQEALEMGLIVGETPEYWNPKPLKNDQIRRLVERGFLAADGHNFFRLTDAGKALVTPAPQPTSTLSPHIEGENDGGGK